MKNTKAFTLIELLVVVLIIGILASVALPQYQKAVRKSRMAQWDVMLNTAQKAAKLYMLESPGTSAILTGKRREGTIEMPGNCDITNNDCYTSVGALKVTIDSGISFTIDIKGKYKADGTTGNTLLGDDQPSISYFEAPSYGTKAIAQIGGKAACEWIAQKHPNIMVVEEGNSCPRSGITLPNPPYTE